MSIKKCFANGMQIELIRSSRKRKKNEINETYQSQMGTKVIINKIQLKFNTNQWNLLFYLIHSYEEYNILLHIQQFIQEQKSLPIKLRFKVTSFNVLFGSILSGIEQFFKMNNDFVSLCCHDRSILLRCAMENAGCLGSILIIPELPFLDYPGVAQSFENNFESVLMDLNRRLRKEIDRDVTFIKLGIGMFVLSTMNCSSYTNSSLDYLQNIKDILRIQDIYGEVTWKYLLYKCDHQQAVICFANFIKSHLGINRAIIEIHQSEQHKRMVKNLIEKMDQHVTVSR
jgi:hypothetical protein